jgi:flagellar biosynthetic protein FliR
MIFALDLHHLVITALNDSYTLFRPGEVPMIGDVAALMAKTVAAAFRIGVQLAAPFLVFGLLFNLGLGILSRLMPQMQVFFIALPAQIAIVLIATAVTLGLALNLFLDGFRDHLSIVVR